MKFRYLFIIFFILSSCSIFFPEGISFNGANYNYNYQTFNKRLDYNKAKYLLTPTKTGISNFGNGTNLENVVVFFKKKLGENVVLSKDFKNKDNKLIIPFRVSYEITDKEISFLKTNTDLNYIILSKIMYLNQLKQDPLNNNNRFINSESGAMSFIKILDVKDGSILLEMSCSGEVTIGENRDIVTGEVKLQPTAIHKDSYALGEKTMKKLLKKIK